MRQKILIIDDDRAHLHSTKAILESDGYEVLTHDEPFEPAIESMRQKPDLVLVDVGMPAVYRANASIRTARVMLYSSYDEDTLRAASMRLQLDGYIRKGNAAALRVGVASALAR